MVEGKVFVVVINLLLDQSGSVLIQGTETLVSADCSWSMLS